jgi:hypothetical protein
MLSCAGRDSGSIDDSERGHLGATVRHVSSFIHGLTVGAMRDYGNTWLSG